MESKCNEVYLGTSRIKKDDTIEITLVDTLYIQFTTFPQGRYKDEKHEKKYQMDIPFDNISKLHFTKLEEVDMLQLMIHVRKPVKVFQSVKQFGGPAILGQKNFEHKEVPSPMMFSRVIYGLKDP